MKTIEFEKLQIDLDQSCETNYQKRISKLKSEKYIYVKDTEGYAAKIPEKDFTDAYTQITEQEWSELSGENYYKQTFGHGGARKGAGRKQLHRNISVRVTIREKDLIEYLREHAIDPSDALKQLLT